MIYYWLLSPLFCYYKRCWNYNSVLCCFDYVYWVILTAMANLPMMVAVIQLLSCVQLFATPWTAVPQASLPITISLSLLKLMSIESVMPSNHLILCRPLHLLPLIFPSIRVFSTGSVLSIRWPKYWSFSISISTSNEYSGLISFRIACDGHITYVIWHCSCTYTTM